MILSLSNQLVCSSVCFFRPKAAEASRLEVYEIAELVMERIVDEAADPPPWEEEKPFEIDVFFYVKKNPLYWHTQQHA